MPPVPKPTAWKRVKASAARRHAAERKACQDVVWKRAGSCCEICGRWLKRPRETDSVMDVGHVHERIYRSRGGSDTDPDNCVLLCGGPGGCHERVHAKKNITEDSTP